MHRVATSLGNQTLITTLTTRTYTCKVLYQTALYNVTTAARNQTMIVAMLCYIQKYAKSLLYTYVHIISNLTQRAHAPRSRVNGESNADHHTDDEYIYMQCGLLYFEIYT